MEKYRPDYFEIYEKFQGWHKCSLRPHKVGQWIKSFKAKSVLPKPVRRTERKFGDDIINKGKNITKNFHF
jgi:hypothetical protein